jgi:phospholipid/cholesterol/gamma-HCH transport system permease protein
VVTDNSSLELNNDRLLFKGDWNLLSLAQLKQNYVAIRHDLKDVQVFDFSAMTKVDSMGVLLIRDIKKNCVDAGLDVVFQNLDKKFTGLFDYLDVKVDSILTADISAPNIFARITLFLLDKYNQGKAFISFFGFFVVEILLIFKRWRNFSFPIFSSLLHNTGLMALPIVALLSLLVGAVLSYQLAVQLVSYGANILIVQVAGVSIFREFGPLITAIVIAGRTGTSFSAFIGTMKVKEELDSLTVMGVSPMIYLVLPRVIALLVTLPLLVVWADIFQLIGSMLVSKDVLDIDYSVFITTFQNLNLQTHFILGLLKVPIFALIISLVGCFQGFSVGFDAESVGLKTTKAAVQSIFLILVADAAYSVILTWLGY